MVSNGGDYSNDTNDSHTHIKFLSSSLHRRDAEINELNNTVEDNNALIAQLQKRIKELEVGFYHRIVQYITTNHHSPLSFVLKPCLLLSQG
jgi:peptidoglycan hydrolase CwlO-like protein